MSWLIIFKLFMVSPSHEYHVEFKENARLFGGHKSSTSAN